MTDPPRPTGPQEHADEDTGISRWVKVFGIVAVLVVLVVVVMALAGGGGHRPRRHGGAALPPGVAQDVGRPGDLGGDTPPEGALG